MEAGPLLIRDFLGLPDSTAVIGIANQAQVSANAASTHVSPMDPAARVSAVMVRGDPVTAPSSVRTSTAFRVPITSSSRSLCRHALERSSGSSRDGQG